MLTRAFRKVFFSAAMALGMAILLTACLGQGKKEVEGESVAAEPAPAQPVTPVEVVTEEPEATAEGEPAQDSETREALPPPVIPPVHNLRVLQTNTRRSSISSKPGTWTGPGISSGTAGMVEYRTAHGIPPYIFDAIVWKGHSQEADPGAWPDGL